MVSKSPQEPEEYVFGKNRAQSGPPASDAGGYVFGKGKTAKQPATAEAPFDPRRKDARGEPLTKAGKPAAPMARGPAAKQSRAEYARQLARDSGLIRDPAATSSTAEAEPKELSLGQKIARMTGVITNAVAPYGAASAAGAVAGAASTGPAAPVGAAAGAVAAPIALGLGDLSVLGYNLIGHPFAKQPAIPPSEMMRMAGREVLPGAFIQPETALERGVSTGAETLAGGVGGAFGANAAAKMFARSGTGAGTRAAETLRVLGDRPIAQSAAAAGGATAGYLAGEAGASPLVQVLAGVAGGGMASHQVTGTARIKPLKSEDIRVEENAAYAKAKELDRTYDPQALRDRARTLKDELTRDKEMGYDPAAHPLVKDALSKLTTYRKTLRFSDGSQDAPKGVLELRQAIDAEANKLARLTDPSSAAQRRMLVRISDELESFMVDPETYASRPGVLERVQTVRDEVRGVNEVYDFGDTKKVAKLLAEKEAELQAKQTGGPVEPVTPDDIASVEVLLRDPAARPAIMQVLTRDFNKPIGDLVEGMLEEAQLDATPENIETVMTQLFTPQGESLAARARSADLDRVYETALERRLPSPKELKPTVAQVDALARQQLEQQGLKPTKENLAAAREDVLQEFADNNDMAQSGGEALIPDATAARVAKETYAAKWPTLSKKEKDALIAQTKRRLLEDALHASQMAPQDVARLQADGRRVVPLGAQLDHILTRGQAINNGAGFDSLPDDIAAAKDLSRQRFKTETLEAIGDIDPKKKGRASEIIARRIAQELETNGRFYTPEERAMLADVANKPVTKVLAAIGQFAPSLDTPLGAAATGAQGVSLIAAPGPFKVLGALAAAGTFGAKRAANVQSRNQLNEAAATIQGFDTAEMRRINERNAMIAYLRGAQGGVYSANDRRDQE
jgi:hypothetical protein